MKELKLKSDTEEIKDIIKKVSKGEICVPDFQRDFVWTRQDVEELIKSILEGVFIGAFLFLRVKNPDNPPFKPKFIKGVDKNEKPRPELLILDGQQRITSLYYAFDFPPKYPLKNTTSPYVFLLDLERLKDDDIENAVFSISTSSKEFKMIYKDGKWDYGYLREKKWFPLCFFAKYDEFDFDDVWEKFKDLFSKEESKKLKQYMKKLYNYEIHYFCLDGENLEKVVILFERLNKTGVQLSPFDLIVARVYKFIKLREKWNEAYENFHYIRELAKEKENTKIPYMIIQAIALSEGYSIKSKDLINIDEKVLNEEKWNEAVDIFENKVLKALIFDRERYGICNPKWIPYFPTITVILALFLRYKYPQEDKIDKWYWSVIFSERYSGKTETVMKQDFDQLCVWFENDNKVPEVVEEIRKQLESSILNLKKVKRFSNAKYKGVFNLLFRRNVKDFYYVYSGINTYVENLEDHHIFPRAFLKRKNIDDELIDCVLNKTLILDETNRRIREKAPGEYIEDLIKEICRNKKISEEEAEKEVQNIFKEHFINEEAFKILRETTSDLSNSEVKEKYKTFLELREKEIIKDLKRLISS